ncbi:MAG TPA: AsmA family protein [Caldimonas sp.]|nr:AsmA family protein [Caldimonas sp.]HEX4235684.1 AsmA family protein [Caldimonas sp.]
MTSRGQAPRPLRALGWAAGGFAVIVALALLLQPWWLAPLVSHHLSASSGRTVQVDAMWLSVTSSFEPVLQARGIRIDNAPWADPHRPLAALAAATAVISWRSVAERRPIIALAVLRDGDVDLELRSDGLRNWRLTRPDDRGPGRVRVLALRGEHATLRLRHEPLEIDLEARATPGREHTAETPTGADTPTWIDAIGTWRGAPFVIGAATASTITLVETGRTFPIRGHAEAGGARLDLDGQVGDIVRWPRFDATIRLVAPSGGRLLSLLGAPVGEAAKSIRLDGTLHGDRDSYALSALKGHLGATDFAGSLRWTRGEQRDLLSAELSSDSADLADLRSLGGHGKVTAAMPAAKTPVALAGASSAASGPPPVRRTRPVDVELRFAARQVRGEELPSLQGVALEASLADGVLRVPHLQVRLGGGQVIGKGSVTLSEQPLRGQAEVDVHAVRIETLLGERATRSQLSGTVSGRAALQTGGASLDALLANATGTISAFVSDGTISSLLDAKMGLQGGRIVRSLITGAEPIALRCAALVVDVRKGEGRIRTLVVDTDRTRTVGSGTIDLADRTLDVVLTPQAKEPGLFVLDRSIRLSGAVGALKHELVARADAAPAAGLSCRPERP